MTYPGPPDSWRRETGFWSSASLRGKSKRRTDVRSDDWVFAITVRNGKLAEYPGIFDTQALARASDTDAELRDLNHRDRYPRNVYQVMLTAVHFTAAR